jgi:DNA-binding XRE family transcriptional regulator
VRLRRSQPAPDERPFAVLGRRIEQARADAGLSRNEMAERLGVDPIQYLHFESGEEDPSEYVPVIADVTGTTAARLRGHEAPPAAEPAPRAPPEPEPAPAAPPIEPADTGPAEPEPTGPEPEPTPEPDHTEEESMSYEFPRDDTPDEPAAPAAPAGESDLDFSEDELTRVVAGLSRQRDSLAARRAELDKREADLDDRERMLSEREDHIGAREDAVSAREDEFGAADSSRSAALEEDWQERLQSFEDTNRQYALAATALAEWAADMRTGGGASDEDEPEPAVPEAAAEHEEPRHDEPRHDEPPHRTGFAEGSDFPDDF